MSHHALIEERPWLLASIAAAVAFYILRDNSLGGIQLMALKGAGVCFSVPPSDRWMWLFQVACLPFGALIGASIRRGPRVPRSRHA